MFERGEVMYPFDDRFVDRCECPECQPEWYEECTPYEDTVPRSYEEVYLDKKRRSCEEISEIVRLETLRNEVEALKRGIVTPEAAAEKRREAWVQKQKRGEDAAKKIKKKQEKKQAEEKKMRSELREKEIVELEREKALIQRKRTNATASRGIVVFRVYHQLELENNGFRY